MPQSDLFDQKPAVVQNEQRYRHPKKKEPKFTNIGIHALKVRQSPETRMPRPRSWSKKSVDGLFYTNTPIQTLQSGVVLRKKKTK